MAKAKKVPTKSPRGLKKDSAGRSMPRLPAGFREIGSLVPFWDMEKDPEIQGIVQSFGLIKGKVEVNPKTKKKEKREDRKTMIVQLGDGRKVTVGESHPTRELFQLAKKGSEVYLRYNGKRPDRKDPKVKYNDITVAIAGK